MDERNDESNEKPSTRYPPAPDGVYECFKDFVQVIEKALRRRHALLPPRARADADAYLAALGLMYRTVARRAEDFEQVWLELRLDDDNTAARTAWLEATFEDTFHHENNHGNRELFRAELAAELHDQSPECRAVMARIWGDTPPPRGDH